MTVSELAYLAIDEDMRCQVYYIDEEKTVFDGSFSDVEDDLCANEIVRSFSIDDGIFVMNI